ncbi:MAG: NUDIX domain-containing protein [Acidimicrobiales bacterium]|nr:NUDIX domain-containing protein [Acidimicrobiales bacterium]
MPDRLHRFALRCYQRLPVLGRRWVVRTIAPSYTVGAMCIIERHDGALLLIRHSYRSRWGVPGGLLNRREDPAVAARREVREEVGLEVDLWGEPAVVVDAVPQRVDLVYRARLSAGAALDDVRPVSAEIAEARWFPPDALPELQHETTTALMALARTDRDGMDRGLRGGEVA